MKYYLSLILIFCISLVSAQDNVWTLEECINYALEHNLALKRAKLGYQGSQVDLKQSKFDLLPNVNANSSYGYNWGRSIDPTSNQFITQRINFTSANASANVTLFSAGRQMNAIKRNEHEVLASMFDVEAAKNTLAFNILAIYTNVIFNKELLENAKKQLENSEKQLTRIDKQVEVGALSRSDLYDIEAQVATNELSVIQQQNALDFSLLQLKQALQLPADTEFEVVVPEEISETEIAEPFVEYQVEEVYEKAIETLPQVKSAKEQIQSTELGVDIAKGGLYPSLNAGIGLSTNYSDAFARFNEDGTFDTELIPGIMTENGVGIVQITPGGSVETVPFTDQLEQNLSKFLSFGLSIPIFNGWIARANIQKAIINQEQSEILLEETKNNIRQDVETAYNDVQAAAKSFIASRKQAEAREEAFRMTEKRYELGATTYIDYQLSENQLFQARSDLLRAKYDYIYKLKILDFYLGNPLGF